MKRTTLILDENRIVDLKKLAAEEKRSMSELVDEILRMGIQARLNKSKSNINISLPTFKMGKTHINIADRDQLEEVMGEE